MLGCGKLLVTVYCVSITERVAGMGSCENISNLDSRRDSSLYLRDVWPHSGTFSLSFRLIHQSQFVMIFLAAWLGIFSFTWHNQAAEDWEIDDIKVPAHCLLKSFQQPDRGVSAWRHRGRETSTYISVSSPRSYLLLLQRMLVHNFWGYISNFPAEAWKSAKKIMQNP